MQNNDVIITSVKPLSLSHILSSFPNKILNKVNNQFTSDTLLKAKTPFTTNLRQSSA